MRETSESLGGDPSYRGTNFGHTLPEVKTGQEQTVEQIKPVEILDQCRNNLINTVEAAARSSRQASTIDRNTITDYLAPEIALLTKPEDWDRMTPQQRKEYEASQLRRYDQEANSRNNNHHFRDLLNPVADSLGISDTFSQTGKLVLDLEITLHEPKDGTRINVSYQSAQSIHEHKNGPADYFAGGDPEMFSAIMGIREGKSDITYRDAEKTQPLSTVTTYPTDIPGLTYCANRSNIGETAHEVAYSFLRWNQA